LRCSTCTSDTVEEGHFVDGKKHGRWVVRDADGSVEEGPMVDNERHGNWVYRSADGYVTKTFYENDCEVEC